MQMLYNNKLFLLLNVSLDVVLVYLQSVTKGRMKVLKLSCA